MSPGSTATDRAGVAGPVSTGSDRLGSSPAASRICGAVSPIMTSIAINNRTARHCRARIGESRTPLRLAAMQCGVAQPRRKSPAYPNRARFSGRQKKGHSPGTDHGTNGRAQPDRYALRQSRDLVCWRFDESETHCSSSNGTAGVRPCRSFLPIILT